MRSVTIVVLIATASADEVNIRRPVLILGTPPDAPDSPLPVRRAELTGAVVVPWKLSPSNREEARNFFNTIYAASEAAVPAWTGNYESCTPGTVAGAFQDLVALRINYFREMAGVPAGITLDPTYNGKAQHAALMMSANTNLSHYPPLSWTCYSAAGAEAAGKANLAIGVLGPDAITGYIEDPGPYNFSVGHRRWLLYPQTRVMGSGDVAGDTNHFPANAVWVFDDHFFGPRPPARDDFVAWPPPGYVPYPVVFPRWSLSYPNADFTNATVTVTRNGVPVTAQVEPVFTGAGENSLAWVMNGGDFPASGSHARPLGDTAYGVQVNGVKVGDATRSFAYTVRVFDPAVSGADTVEPRVIGPPVVQMNQPTTFTFTPVPKADGHEVRLSRSTPLTVTEGGEDKLANFDPNLTPGYSVTVGMPKVSGSYAIHLTHLNPPKSQVLTYRKTVLVGTNASITLKSRLGYATTNQHARVQVSTDNGGRWKDVFVQTGTSTAGENSFSSRIGSLTEFVGRSVAVRLLYDYSGGGFYSDAATHVGWLVDDLKFVNCFELTAPQVVEVTTGNRALLTVSANGPHVLEARAKVFGGYPLEWGPALFIGAQTSPVLSVKFDANPRWIAGKLEIEFTATAATGSTQFSLWRSANATEMGTKVAGAGLVNLGGSRYRFTITPAAVEFFRISSP